MRSIDMRQIDARQIAVAYAILGIDLGSYTRGPSFEAVVAQLKQAKVDAKIAFKRLAFDVHPDRGGDEKKFRLLAEAHEIVQRVEIQPEPPRPPPRMRIFTRTFGDTSTTTTFTHYV